MANQKSSSYSNGLGSFMLGPALAAGFYGILFIAPIPILQRYFMGHPVAVVATCLFGIAMVSLALRWFSAQRELHMLQGFSDAQLKPHDGPYDSVVELTTAWLNHLESLPVTERSSQVANRVAEILGRQQRRKTARFLNEDLREISDREADASHDGLQLVRIIIWAIPMLGFLGTVIGITQTLGGLDFTDAQNAVDKLKAGLYVAFDTTALGLVLSVIAIFVQLPVEKKLADLLAQLDEKTTDIFFGAFPNELPSNAPLEAIAEMHRAVLSSVGELVERQADIWRGTVDSANEHWASIVGTAGDQVQIALADAIEESLLRAQKSAASLVDERWKQWQTTLSENARLLRGQQEAIVEQNQALIACGERAADIASMRSLLESNLNGLSNFPDIGKAMLSLARAIDTLNDRVAVPGREGRAA